MNRTRIFQHCHHSSVYVNIYILRMVVFNYQTVTAFINKNHIEKRKLKYLDY